MAVIALETIRHNRKYYKKGEVISQIAKKDEERLLALGVAEKQASSKTNKDEK